MKNGIDFSHIHEADFRIENLNLPLVFHHLYTKYFPQLEEDERKLVISSWEKLRTDLESSSNRQFPHMSILDFPKQAKRLEVTVPGYIQEHFKDEVRELKGAKHISEPQASASVFKLDIKEGLDVLIYTKSKSSRPWLGKVCRVMQSKNSFDVHFVLYKLV